MKILFVANVSDLYGASRSLLRLASALAESGHTVEAILPEDGPLRPRLEEAGVRVAVHQGLPVLTRRALRSPGGLARLLWRIPVSVVRLARHLRRTRPDVVHTNSAVVFTPGVAARICRVPHVWHMREFLADVSRLWIVYQRFMSAAADAIVCNSAAVAAQFTGGARRKTRVIYNGIPERDYRPGPAPGAVQARYGIAGDLLVGMAGRINLDQKGQDVFVRAAALLAPQFPRAGFVIAGSPYPGNEAHAARLGALIDELGMKNRVFLTGDVADAAALYSALDVCVLPAVKPEGLGNVLLEAMALSKPVAGSAIGGIPEVIEDGGNGFLVPPGDAAALAERLGQLLGDAGLRRRMGEAGRRRFEDLFRFEVCRDKVLALYESLAAGRPEPRTILGMRVDPTSYQAASAQVVEWARAGESRYVCAASVNNVMEAHDSSEFQRIMNQADLVTPDGMPLVWGLRLMGARGARRVYGPDLTPAVLAAAERESLPVGFYGASGEVLGRLLAEVQRRFPELDVRYSFAPPFRPLGEEEDRDVVAAIRASGVRVLFVGLSTPKQERWMAAHRGRVPAVMLGVGAAFDFLAGVKPQAPRWMQNAGLEWSFRLATEPRRLWRRYLKHNPRFAALFARQLLANRFSA